MIEQQNTIARPELDVSLAQEPEELEQDAPIIEQQVKKSQVHQSTERIYFKTSGIEIELSSAYLGADVLIGYAQGFLIWHKNNFSNSGGEKKQNGYVG